MKRLFRVIGIVLLIPILLFVLITVLLYIPPVQNFVVKEAAAIASDAAGMDISIGRLGLTFPLNLDIENILVVQAADKGKEDSMTHKPDTIADIGRVTVNVKFRPLLKGVVMFDALEIDDAKINTADIVSSALVKGQVGELKVIGREVELSTSVVDIGDVTLKDAQLYIALADSVPEDTTTASEPTAWTILIDNIGLSATALTLVMHDSIETEAYIGTLTLTETELDLGGGSYDVKTLQLKDSRVNYDDMIAADGITVQLDSVHYCDPDAKVVISALACSIAYGNAEIGIEKCQATLAMDSTSVHVPCLTISTADSQIDAAADMDLNAFDSIPGQFRIRARADIGKQDMLTALSIAETDAVNSQLYPNYPLTLIISADGNMKHLDITGIEMTLPTALSATIEGYAENLDDTDHLKANIELDATTENLDFIIGTDYTLPRGIGIRGQAAIDASSYKAKLNITEGKGGMNMKAAIDGCGTDIFDKSTRLNADLRVDSFAYDSIKLGDITLEANLEDGIAHASLVSENTILNGSITIDGLLTSEKVEATLSADIKDADLRMLHVTENDIGIAFCTHLDLSTDMVSAHRIEGQIADFRIQTAEQTFTPPDLSIDACARPDTLWAMADCGDFNLSLCTSGGYEQVLNQINILTDSLQAQVTDRRIDYEAIKPLFPTATLHVNSGQKNPVYAFLKTQGIGFELINADIGTDPERGIWAGAHAFSLTTDSVQIDTIKMWIKQDGGRVTAFGQVRNSADNPQYIFNAMFNAAVFDRGASLGVKLYDEDDALSVELGLMAEVNDEGLAVHLFPDKPTLWYMPFTVNHGNYIQLARTNKITADVDLLADNGTRFSLLSHEKDEDADTTLLQDITLSIDKLNLAELTSVIPYAPEVSGVMGGDFHIMADSSRQISMTSYTYIDSLVYEDCELGNISSDFAYMLREDTTHALSATLMIDDEQVIALDGTYKNTEEGDIDATMTLEQVPLHLVNGFIPDQLLGFRGYGQGELAVTGTLAKPVVDGVLNVDSVHVISIPYGVDLRANDAPITITASNLTLENFALYSYNENPLKISGNVDFADLDKIKLNLGIAAKNYQIINSKEQKGSIAYGKGFIDVGMLVSGSLEQLKIRGIVNVLGTTNMTYILTDSPLTTDDRLKDLVTFTDFRDTTEVKVYRAAPSGMDMTLTLKIEEGARIFCALNATKTNYVDVEGGGDLRLTWGDDDEMSLTGRYTINSGEMKYELPIIPLKTFTIGEGSYIEFTGEIMNPTLNISATEEVKATVSSDGGDSRTVTFDCGVKVTQTLSNMGLEFTLDAPEDLTVKNELASMSTEDRGKAAVTMLTTGMYISDGNTEGFSMNSALNSFLQSEINSITGSALRSIDLSVGLDTSSDSYGNTHTDYSFKFAKRLWNNRVNFVIGGKISGSDSSTDDSSDDAFIDNVSLEYRLDASSMRYIKVFYDRGAYDLLEGRVTEYGAGFIWRKKADKFWQLFNFKSNDNTYNKK